MIFHSRIKMNPLDQIQTFPPNGPQIPNCADGCSYTIIRKDFSPVLYLILGLMKISMGGMKETVARDM